MSDEKTQPGIRKAVPPRPDEYKEVSLSDFPSTSPTRTPMPTIPRPATVPLLTEDQIHAIAKQLHAVAVNTIRDSVAPGSNPPRPSLASRTAKQTWTKSKTATLVVAGAGIGAELAARALLKQPGPWSGFFSTLGKILELFSGS